MLRRLGAPALLAVLVVALVAPLAPAGPATAAGGRPARVKITFKPNATGRVISDRAACYREVPVFAFGRATGGSIIPAETFSTDDDGRFPSAGNPRAVVADFFALTVGTAKCRVAQSDDVRYVRGTAPAKRRVSLSATPTTQVGKVSSKRARCVQEVPVGSFVRFGSSGEWMENGLTTTDGSGRYSFDATRGLRGGATEFAVVAFADKACRVAQSPIRTIG